MTKRVALITGASSGIGLAIAKRLSCDYHLALCSSNPSKLEQAGKSILERTPTAEVFIAVADVRDTNQVNDAVAATATHFDGIDILINCAGIGGGGITSAFSERDWENMLDVNLTGVFRVTTAVLRKSHMLERGWGRIINIASTGGKQGVVYAAAYSATKHGVIGFTKSLGLELAKTGVTVNAVCPGFVETPLSELARINYAKLWQCSPVEAKHRIEQRVPLGRYIEPDEVASLVSYIASDQSGGVLGQAFNVCGGLGNY